MSKSKKSHLSSYQLINTLGHNGSESRIVMTTQHLNQVIPIANSEKPRIYSVYNNVVTNDSTSSYKRVDENKKVLSTYNVFAKRYVILEDKKNKLLELYDISDKILDGGFVSKIDRSFKIGDTINKGELLYTTQEVDKNLNLCIGKNVNLGVMLHGDNFDDAYTVSESFSKSMLHDETVIIEFVVNSNEFLVNINGNEEIYKPLPEINDVINKNSHIILAKRKLNKDEILYNTKTSL